MTGPDSPVATTLRSVAASGLAGAAGDWPPEPLADDAWSLLMHDVRSGAITGLLADVVDQGLLPVTENQRAEVGQVHTAHLHTCLLLEEHLLATVDLLAGAGVEVRVLKGPAVAHLDYHDPSQRTFGDIDLLVRSHDYDAAVRALVDSGGARRYREVRPGFDRRFGKGACVVAPSGFETDLHRTLVMGPFGLWLDLEAVWSSAQPFRLGGRDLLALGVEGRFLSACYHAALGDSVPRLGQLRDVAQLLRGAPVPVDVERARAMAGASRGEAVVARAVSLTWDALGLAEDATARWARGYRQDWIEARAMRTYLDRNLGYAARSMMALIAVPGWRAKAAFVRALAFPSPSYGAGRHRTRARRWRTAIRELRRLIGRRA